MKSWFYFALLNSILGFILVYSNIAIIREIIQLLGAPSFIHPKFHILSHTIWFLCFYQTSSHALNSYLKLTSNSPLFFLFFLVTSPSFACIIIIINNIMIILLLLLLCFVRAEYLGGSHSLALWLQSCSWICAKSIPCNWRDIFNMFNNK